MSGYVLRPSTGLVTVFLAFAFTSRAEAAEFCGAEYPSPITPAHVSAVRVITGLSENARVYAVGTTAVQIRSYYNNLSVVCETLGTFGDCVVGGGSVSGCSEDAISVGVCGALDNAGVSDLVQNHPLSKVSQGLNDAFGNGNLYNDGLASQCMMSPIDDLNEGESIVDCCQGEPGAPCNTSILDITCGIDLGQAMFAYPGLTCDHIPECSQPVDPWETNYLDGVSYDDHFIGRVRRVMLEKASLAFGEDSGGPGPDADSECDATALWDLLTWRGCGGHREVMADSRPFDGGPLEWGLYDTRGGDPIIDYASTADEGQLRLGLLANAAAARVMLSVPNGKARAQKMFEREHAQASGHYTREHDTTNFAQPVWDQLGTEPTWDDELDKWLSPCAKEILQEASYFYYWMAIPRYTYANQVYTSTEDPPPNHQPYEDGCASRNVHIDTLAWSFDAATDEFVLTVEATDYEYQLNDVTGATPLVIEWGIAEGSPWGTYDYHPRWNGSNPNRNEYRFPLSNRNITGRRVRVHLINSAGEVSQASSIVPDMLP